MQKFDLSVKFYEEQHFFINFSPKYSVIGQLEDVVCQISYGLISDVLVA